MINKLKEIVGDVNVYQNEDMCKHTTFKVGGPADIFVKVNDTEELEFLSDKIYVLERGKLIAEGTPEEVAADEKVITSYLGKGIK